MLAAHRAECGRVQRSICALWSQEFSESPGAPCSVPWESLSGGWRVGTRRLKVDAGGWGVCAGNLESMSKVKAKTGAPLQEMDANVSASVSFHKSGHNPPWGVSPTLRTMLNQFSWGFSVKLTWSVNYHSLISLLFHPLSLYSPYLISGAV